MSWSGFWDWLTRQNPGLETPLGTLISLEISSSSTSLTHIGEYEPSEGDVLVDHLLQVDHLIGGRPVQENVEGDGRALVLDLVDQRRETDGVVNLQQSYLSITSFTCSKNFMPWYRSMRAFAFLLYSLNLISHLDTLGLNSIESQQTFQQTCQQSF